MKERERRGSQRESYRHTARQNTTEREREREHVRKKIESNISIERKSFLGIDIHKDRVVNCPSIFNQERYLYLCKERHTNGNSLHNNLV
jgi:hypothetical protein